MHFKYSQSFFPTNITFLSQTDEAGIVDLDLGLQEEQVDSQESLSAAPGIEYSSLTSTPCNSLAQDLSSSQVKHQTRMILQTIHIPSHLVLLLQNLIHQQY